MGTPIKFEDIRKGDTIREEYDDGSSQGAEIRSVEYVAAMNKNTQNRLRASRWFLLDRPRKVIHAKGTTLYLKRDHHDAKKGDPVTVTQDHFEGERVVNAIQANGYKDGYPYDYWLTTEKPRVPKHKRGDALYVREGHGWSDITAGTRVTVTQDFFEGDATVAIRLPDSSASFPGVYRLTDEKPEPTLVAVPLPAIEKLRDEHSRALGVSNDFDARRRNGIRREALNTFLDTREVKTALREDDSW